MNVEYFISKRIISAKENKNVFSRPIIRITISAIALSVAVMLISLSVLDGFKSEITNKVISFGSHIQISAIQKSDDYYKVPVSVNDTLINSIKNENNVHHIDGVIYNFGLIKTNDEFLGINLKGVSSDYNFDFFRENLIKGDVINSDSSILISSNIASKLKLDIGEKLRIYFPNISDEKINVRPFYISGIYNTSMEEFDAQLALVNIENLIKVNNWNQNQVEILVITLSDFEKLDESTINLMTSIDDYYKYDVSSITDLYPQIFDWLNLQDVNVRVIIILMLLVAGVNIVSSILILILEKTKLIGILKSLGLSNWSVRKVFLYNSMYLISKGLLYGNVLGFTLLMLQQKFNIISLDEKSYYMKTIPISFDISSILFLNIGTLLICFLMMIVPTIVITKISPIKAIRFQ
ncbi:MAG: ABC transporter permease [Flavobacteriales bacterium]|jgi:lipoprotein-releasing system permease protein|nr:ABC transporter permease [Flavobacteriales bacterium]MBT4478174.1 ABC transporter permease [Flavobacteriales bacterium]MBT6014268.1 ABC transporter permease [Flavobacteriales bacterium]MBT7481270.1 ABC transporter permease [Flavobacteriales bacterium]